VRVFARRISPVANTAEAVHALFNMHTFEFAYRQAATDQPA
jgi:hypothetical protein